MLLYSHGRRMRSPLPLRPPRHLHIAQAIVQVLPLALPPVLHPALPPAQAPTTRAWPPPRRPPRLRRFQSHLTAISVPISFQRLALSSYPVSSQRPNSKPAILSPFFSTYALHPLLPITENNLTSTSSPHNPFSKPSSPPSSPPTSSTTHAPLPPLAAPTSPPWPSP